MLSVYSRTTPESPQPVKSYLICIYTHSTPITHLNKDPSQRSKPSPTASPSASLRHAHFACHRAELIDWGHVIKLHGNSRGTSLCLRRRAFSLVPWTTRSYPGQQQHEHRQRNALKSAMPPVQDCAPGPGCCIPDSSGPVTLLGNVTEMLLRKPPYMGCTVQ